MIASLYVCYTVFTKRDAPVTQKKEGILVHLRPAAKAGVKSLHTSWRPLCHPPRLRSN